MDTIGKIKRIIEDLQYRTDEKSSKEIYDLALDLFELAAEHRFSNEANHPHTSNSESLVKPPAASAEAPSRPPEPLLTAASAVEDSSESAVKIAPSQPEQPEGAIVTPAIEESAPVDQEEQMDEPTPREEPEADEKPTPREEPGAAASALDEKQNTPVISPAPRLQRKMKIGFNDRFAFINKLFHGDAEEYGIIIAAIEGMSDFHQAENYINMVVKPDFDWSEAEEYEERFMACIEQHFA